jgi:hypothetical protein
VLVNIYAPACPPISEKPKPQNAIKPQVVLPNRPITAACGLGFIVIAFGYKKSVATN